MPGWGLTVLLPQAIGVRRAREMSFTGNFLSAEEAFHWGLVNGRTQTHLPWPGFEGLYADGGWHHDMLHADGTPYDADEIAEFRRWCRVARG